MSYLGEVLRLDGFAFAISAIALLGAVLVGEMLRSIGGVAPESSRRLVHALTGIFVVICPGFFERPDLIYVLALGFVFFNLRAIRKGWLPGLHGIQRPSYGTVTFPLALIAGLFFAWTLDPHRLFALQTAFLVLAFSDPLASYVGSKRRGPRNPGKTRTGTFTFALSASGLIAGALFAFKANGQIDWLATEILLVAVLLAGILAAVEALGRQGWDNFWIVLVALVVLIHFDEQPTERYLLGPAVLLGVLFGIGAYLARFLDRRGAITAGLLAISVVALGGWAWAVPGFTFFLLASLLSKLGRRKKAAAQSLAEKGDVRDAGQVLANGGIAWMMLLLESLLPMAAPLWGHYALYWAYLAAFSAAAADTWATEIGSLMQRRPRLITNLRRVAAGTSGAVSLWGTFGAAMGASSVWAAGLIVAPIPFSLAGVGPSWWLVVGSGLFGAFFDSWLGATVQARYRDPRTGQLSERGRGHWPLARGWPWLDNDRVNLLGTLAGAVFALICIRAFDFGF